MQATSRPSNPSASLADLAPTDAAFTHYDEEHFALYLSLLHAQAEGTPAPQIAREVFGIDPEAEPERATTMVKSHLDRARWLSTHGRLRVFED
jgi:hypothetical protein